MKNVVISVVIPCFKVKNSILDVIKEVPSIVHHILVIDDACPEQSGSFVEKYMADPRVSVIYHPKNRGVGGAAKTGIHAALELGADIIVKIDGDGQMNPKLIEELISPIVEGVADYVKGNRFFFPDQTSNMPFMRWIGNIGLSFITKASSGYWRLFDPTNGFFAIHKVAANFMPWDKIDDRYFFESDLLFRLNIIKGVVVEYPMRSVYRDETSGLSVAKSLVEFSAKNMANFLKRIFYRYFLRDFNIASMQLILGLTFTLFGVTYGGINWIGSVLNGRTATAGTVMLSALPFLLGVQFILSFLNFDMSEMPEVSLQKKIGHNFKFFLR